MLFRKIALIVFLAGCLGFGLEARLASAQSTQLYEELEVLRQAFATLRQSAENAEDDWLQQHRSLLSLEDTRAAHENLITLFEGDLALVNGHLFAHRPSFDPGFVRKDNFVSKIVLAGLQGHFLREILASHEVLHTLYESTPHVLRIEQQARLHYYGLEKILAQVDYQIRRKSEAFTKLQSIRPDLDRSQHIVVKTRAQDVSLLLDDVSTRSMKSLTWPEVIRPLESVSQLRQPARGHVLKTKQAPAFDGHYLAVRAKARIHIPFDGLVVFADYFRDLQGLIILAHRGGWYSILGGLDQIDCHSGQWVFANEPVGRMPTGVTSVQRALFDQIPEDHVILYFGLRDGNNAIKPPFFTSSKK